MAVRREIQPLPLQPLSMYNKINKGTDDIDI
jgi:hypothetical protein